MIRHKWSLYEKNRSIKYNIVYHNLKALECEKENDINTKVKKCVANRLRYNEKKYSRKDIMLYKVIPFNSTKKWLL